MFIESSETISKKRVRELFRMEIGEPAFSTWFTSLELVAIVDVTAYASVATPYLAKRLKESCSEALLRALKKDNPQIEQVEISARSFWKSGARNESAPPGICGECIEPLKVRKALTGRISVNEIIDKTCAYYNITHDVLIEHGREPGITLPRQIAYFLAHHLTGYSHPVIAKKFEGRSQSTVRYGVIKITELIKTNVELAFEIATIEARLRGMELSLHDS